jgi:hypothetical protein
MPLLFHFSSSVVGRSKKAEEGDTNATNNLHSLLFSMSTPLASALFCGSGLAVLMRQRLLRQIEAKPILKRVSPPVAKKVACLQYFGKHPERPDEYRGDDIMDPPRSHSDDYQWLRDDSRTNEEVRWFLNY